MTTNFKAALEAFDLSMREGKHMHTDTILTIRLALKLADAVTGEVSAATWAEAAKYPFNGYPLWVTLADKGLDVRIIQAGFKAAISQLLKEIEREG